MSNQCVKPFASFHAQKCRLNSSRNKSQQQVGPFYLVEGVKVLKLSLCSHPVQATQRGNWLSLLSMGRRQTRIYREARNIDSLRLNWSVPPNMEQMHKNLLFAWELKTKELGQVFWGFVGVGNLAENSFISILCTGDLSKTWNSPQISTFSPQKHKLAGKIVISGTSSSSAISNSGLFM